MAVTSSTDSWKHLASRMKGAPAKAGPSVQRMIARMSEIWPFNAARGILDNGCGSGSIISYILEEYGDKLPASATVTAGDFSQSMLDVLRAHKQAHIDNNDTAWDRLQIYKLDAHDLKDFDDDSISHVTGGHLYFLLDNPQRALAATNRVLCPGGLVGLTSGKSSQHIDALCTAVETIKPGTNLKLLKEPWSTELGVQGELRACGFERLETFLVESTITCTDLQEFARTLLLMPVMQETLRGFSDEDRNRLLIHLVENLRAMDPSERGVFTGVNIVAVGRKAF